MLNKIIRFSLHNRLLIIVGALLLMLVGYYSVRQMEVDVFPDLNAPTVVVMTEAHGMAPEEVEQLVSFPIETAINGATGLRRVRSSSAMGFSIVWAEFDWGMDVYNARQVVAEKLMTIRDRFPKGVGSPTLAPQSSLMGEVMVFTMTSDSTSPMDLRTLADWQVRPRILSVGGVAQVNTIGGEYKEYQILVNPEKLRYYGIRFDELMELLNGYNDNVPGGFIEEYGNNYIVRGIGRSNRVGELGNTVIRVANGFPVKLSDVAELRIGPAPKIGDGSYKGRKAVVLTVSKQPNVNTRKLSDNINTELATIAKTLPPDVKIHTDVFSQRSFIDTSVSNVERALMEGAIFVAIILALFLMNYRTTLISLAAIPLSLLMSVIVMKLMGYTINTMVLGGMTIAIGSLVDDAIIDVENVYKRLRENIKLPKKKRRKSLKVIYKASVEIRASIMNATLIIIVAFIPLFFLSGMEGRMLRPLGVAYIISLFSSLVVAITVTPVLSSLLLVNRKQLKKHSKGSWLETKTVEWYRTTLIQVMRAKNLTIGLSVALFIVALIFLSRFGGSFLPPFNEGTLTINVASMPGISLAESDKIGREAEQLLLSVPEIQVTERRTGRAELAEHAFGANVSEIDAPFLLGKRSRDAFLAEVRQKLNTLPGVSIEVGQPISHRINHMLSGSRADIAISVYGTSLPVMHDLGERIKSLMVGIEGVADPFVEQQIEIPQIRIRPKREMLARYGIPMKQFNRFVDVAFAGEKMGDVFEKERSFDLVLRFDDEHRGNIEAIKNALIDTGDGRKVPLYYVADVRSESGPNTINRMNVQRKLLVSCNVADRDLNSVVKDISNEVEQEIVLPEGYRVEYGGQFESAADAQRKLLLASLFALLVIYLLLYQEFKDIRVTSIILLNLPLALIGGVMAVAFTSGVMSIPAIIGFITLFGIATRNGILLVSRYQALKKDGVGLYRRIIRGSADRLNPILMTALTAALALIPLAVNGDLPGNEIQSPMAIVILGGLLTSTLLNIFVIPVVYFRLNRKEIKEEEKR